MYLILLPFSCRQSGVNFSPSTSAILRGRRPVEILTQLARIFDQPMQARGSAQLSADPVIGRLNAMPGSHRGSPRVSRVPPVPFHPSNPIVVWWWSWCQAHPARGRSNQDVWPGPAALRPAHLIHVGEAASTDCSSFGPLSLSLATTCSTTKLSLRGRRRRRHRSRNRIIRPILSRPLLESRRNERPPPESGPHGVSSTSRSLKLLPTD